MVAHVKAFYQCLCRETVIEVLEHELEKHSTFNIIARKIVVKLNTICLNNPILQYCNQLYIQKQKYNRW